MHSGAAYFRMQTQTIYACYCMCIYKHTWIHLPRLAGPIYMHTLAHKRKKNGTQAGGGVRLMYFDDMKVDHIYMQIEVPD